MLAWRGSDALSATAPSLKELNSNLQVMSRNRRDARCGFLFGAPEADAPNWVRKLSTSPIEKLIPTVGFSLNGSHLGLAKLN